MPLPAPAGTRIQSPHIHSLKSEDLPQTGGLFLYRKEVILIFETRPIRRPQKSIQTTQNAFQKSENTAQKHSLQIRLICS